MNSNTYAAAVASLGDTRPAADDRLAVKPKKAAEMLGVGITRLYDLLNTGQLASYKDGGSRKIVVASIRAYIAARMKATAESRQHESRAT